MLCGFTVLSPLASHHNDFLLKYYMVIHMKYSIQFPIITVQLVHKWTFCSALKHKLIAGEVKWAEQGTIGHSWMMTFLSKQSRWELLYSSPSCSLLSAFHAVTSIQSFLSEMNAGGYHMKCEVTSFHLLSYGLNWKIQNSSIFPCYTFLYSKICDEMEVQIWEVNVKVMLQKSV